MTRRGLRHVDVHCCEYLQVTSQPYTCVVSSVVLGRKTHASLLHALDALRMNLESRLERADDGQL